MTKKQRLYADLWDLLIILRSNQINVDNLCHQECGKEIVETKDFRGHRPSPRQLVKGKDTDSQQTAAYAACQSDTYSMSLLAQCRTVIHYNYGNLLLSCGKFERD